MSEQNVELVRSLQPAPDVDLIAVFRDEPGLVDRQFEGVLHDDFLTEGTGLQGGDAAGLDGLREGWADWLDPWESYRVEIDEVIDAGDDVVVLTHDYGRRPGMTAEVSTRGAAIWTVRDGKIARIRFYPNREDGLRAAGLAD